MKIISFHDTVIIHSQGIQNKKLIEDIKNYFNDDKQKNNFELKIEKKERRESNDSFLVDYYVSGFWIDTLKANLAYLFGLKVQDLSSEIRVREYSNYLGGWHYDVGRNAEATIVIYLTDQAYEGGLVYRNIFNGDILKIEPNENDIVFHTNVLKNKQLNEKVKHRSERSFNKKIIIVPVINAYGSDNDK